MDVTGLTLGQLALALYALGYYATRDEALCRVGEDPTSARLLLTAHHGPEMRHDGDVAAEGEWGPAGTGTDAPRETP